MLQGIGSPIAHAVRSEIGEDVNARAVILSGSIGHGHDVIAQVVARSLHRLSWDVRILDCMALLGSVGAKLGDQVFRRLTARPALYDAVHFAHLRQGGAVTEFMDRAATKRLVRALRAELRREPAELVVSAFATGASAAAKIEAEAMAPSPKTIVLCTDALLHRLWVHDGIDMYLVTSAAAAASTRRYLPHANVSIIPPPVRDGFYTVSSQEAARAALGIPAKAPCVLLMGGGWGLGPIVEVASALTQAGVHVLALAGRNEALERQLCRRANADTLLHAFGYTERVPELMAASDLVVTTPGATTCSEARVVGRRLVLLDAVPGHGRENLQHELEVGDAEASSAEPEEVVAVVTAALDRLERPISTGARPAGEWDEAFGVILATMGFSASVRSAHRTLLASGSAPGISRGKEI